MEKPLAVYIHWPFCKAKCPYCDFNSHVRDEIDHDKWQQALLRELEYMAEHVQGRQVSSIFFGGGTPSLMPPEIAKALITRVRELWKVRDDVEITLEANPTSVEAATFPSFKAAGVNRVSLGVQSFDDKQLQFLGREHSADEALAAIKQAKQHFERYSFDLIYARPQQTADEWKKELASALELAGGHISLYQLTIEENTAFYHAYKNGGFILPDEELSEALYLATEEMTKAHGLLAYEVSNYAAAGQESRHNMAYWQGDDYIGIGPGAHGRATLNAPAIAPAGAHMARSSGLARPTDRASGNSYPEESSDCSSIRIATQTLKSPERWLSQVEKNGHALEVWQEIDVQTEMEERLMMGLRLCSGIDLQQFKAQNGHDLMDYINADKCQLFTKQGLLANQPDKLQATLKGRLLLNQLTAELLH